MPRWLVQNTNPKTYIKSVARTIPIVHLLTGLECRRVRRVWVDFGFG